MKNIRYRLIIWTLLAGLLLVGCDDFLNKQPLESLSKDKFWKTEKDAQLWNIGMYDEIQNTLGLNFYMWGEVRSDNQKQGGTGTDQANYLNNNLTSSLAPCNWKNLYRAISSANFGIKYYPRIGELTETQLNSYLGQAYTTRALMYFYAIRVWGDVPLIIEPYEGLPGQQMYYKRTPVAQIKTQIISDIESAIRCFAGTTSSTPYFLNIGTALALKADLHMWFKEYPEAVKATDDIISLDTYKLAKNEKEWKDCFDKPTSSSEAIFYLNWDPVTDGKNGIAVYIASDTPNPNYKVRKPIWDSLVRRQTDARWWYMTDTVKLWLANNRKKIDESSYSITDYNYVMNFYTNKFSKYDPAFVSVIDPKYSPGGYPGPSTTTYMPAVPIYRFSDIMLLRAEALNKVNRSEEARAIVNDIRKRIGYIHTAMIDDPNFVPDPQNPEAPVPQIQVVLNEVTATNTPDGDELDKVIFQERQFELWGEGKRWFDLVRTDRVLEYMNPILETEYGKEEGFGDIRRILFPLHSSVFEANPLLVQNEPYTQN